MSKITPAKLLRTAVTEVGEGIGMTYDQFHDYLLSAVLIDCFVTETPPICVSALKEIRKEVVDQTMSVNFRFHRQDPIEKVKPGKSDPRD